MYSRTRVESMNIHIAGLMIVVNIGFGVYLI